MDAVNARQQRGKHIFVAKNKGATVEELLEAVFLVRSALRLCNEEQQQSRQSQSQSQSQSQEDPEGSQSRQSVKLNH
jgi:hypothetical protein